MGTLDSEFAAIMARIRRDRLVTGTSLNRYELLGVSRHLEHRYGLARLRDLSPEQASWYITRPHVGDKGITEASINTQHERRSKLRLTIRVARQIGLVERGWDPTLDIRLPSRGDRTLRPLTDVEQAIVRDCSLTTLSETRIPTAVALAEATATTPEQACIRVSHLDLAGRRVWILGGRMRRARWGRLTEWGLIQIERRLRALGPMLPENPLLSALNGRMPTRRRPGVSDAIASALGHAGLAGEPGIRPASIIAWAGAHAFENGARIHEVALMLGLRSLDQAAELIGLSWRVKGPE